VVLVGCGESQQSAPAPEAKPEPPTVKTPDISIHKAATFGNIEAVKQHLANRTDVNAKDLTGFAPLVFAASCGHKEIVELLIDKGADVNVKNSGKTPLDWAIEQSHTETAELLRKHGGKRGSELPLATLFEAVKQVDLQGVKDFLAKGADVNAKDDSGWTPLIHAANRGHNEVAALLIAKGADVNAQNEGGVTTLSFAVSEGHKEIAELLIAKGVDVNTKDDSGWTPLYYAAIGGHKEVVELLIAKDANVNAKCDGGMNPLHKAAAEGHKEIAELLIAKGADVNAKRYDGATPLDCATWFSQSEIADLLRKHGGKYGTIHVAARGGDIEAVKEFLATGTDVNVKDEWSRTPLDFANGETADLLRKPGGKTDEELNDTAIIDLLRKHGGKTKMELKAEGK
jgi:cytohesin